MITQKRLHELVEYDHHTGQMVWIGQRKRVRDGSTAGSAYHHGYVRICVDGRKYRAHHLAWLYVYGELPTAGLDHIDGDTRNNAISNLRPATNAQNQQNKGLRKDNRTGFIGVQKAGDRFVARIAVKGKRHHLGSFDTAEGAFEAYKTAKRKFHTFSPEVRN